MYCTGCEVTLGADAAVRWIVVDGEKVIGQHARIAMMRDVTWSDASHTTYSRCTETI